MAVEIQLRRDTAANWTSEDPTLAEGEPGYETDTGKIKYGDGATAWTALAYAWQPIRIVEASVAFDDFDYEGGTGITTEPVYTLQPGEQLLHTCARVTEVFNDSSATPIYLVDAGNNINIGLTTGDVGPDVPMGVAGLVSLDFGTPGNPSTEIPPVVTPDTTAVPLHLNIGAALPADGTTGAVTVWLYIATP